MAPTSAVRAGRRFRAFHREGVEVILDVVFSDTGEGNELGPRPLSFRGIDSAIYCSLADDKRFYLVIYFTVASLILLRMKKTSASVRWRGDAQ